MPARHVNYYDYDRSASLTCPHCGAPAEQSKNRRSPKD